VWGDEEPEAVAAVERLAGASMLEPAPTPLTALTGNGRRAEAARYRLHDLLAEYAAARLAEAGEREATHRAHAGYLIALFEQHYTGNPSTAPEVALELDNLRAAAAWALESGEGEALARLATKPRNWLYNVFRAWDEWLEWLVGALRIGTEDQQLEASVRKAIGDVQQFRKQTDAALDSYQQALALFRAVGHRLGEANVLAAQARMALQGGDLGTAERNLEAVIAVRRAMGDLYSEGADYFNFAVALLRLGQPAQARPYALKALAVFERLGEPALLRQVAALIAACEQG
jgi:tetratricopeptide (TPR) repeat protein